MSWKIFSQSSPELASIALEHLNRKIAYLATIKKDGSPRLHPVTPFIGDGKLFIFTAPNSPKIRDLRRDSRYALHCSVGAAGEPLVEVLVSGSAEIITDPAVRERLAAIADSPVVTASFFLFEYLVHSILILEYDPDGKPISRRWEMKSD